MPLPAFFRTVFLLLFLAAAAPAAALSLLGSVGSDEDASILVEIDPATGAVVREIGPVGYLVNGMTFDPATNTLYATTGAESPVLGNGVLTIDLRTGAGTPIGTGAGRYVNLPTIAPNGTLWAWSQGPATANRLVTINRTTGVATIAGNPQVQTFAHSFAFGIDGVLYLLNGDSNLYTINTTTFVSTPIGNVTSLPHQYAHHGTIHPVTGLLYALTSKDAAPDPTLVAIDLATRNVMSVVPVRDGMHTLAWVKLPTVVAVTRSGSGTGSVTSSDGQIQCGSTCSHQYFSPSTVTLTAAADSGSIFTGWLGACTGSDSCTVDTSSNATVSATFAPSSIGTHTLDIDNNSKYEPLTDGLILIRRLFGLVGAPMTNNAIGVNAQRSDPGAIATYIGDVYPKFDVDANGKVDALTDGLLIIRYLFGLRGNPLIASAIGPGSARTTFVQIETYLQTLIP